MGEPSASGRNGREFRLSLFKFFVSQVALLDALGNATEARLVAADGTPEPYGLHLVDAEDASTQILRLSAAPGDYRALRLGVGVPEPCNRMAVDQVFPLNPDSDMFWSWGGQFMFVRIEGSSRPNAGAGWVPFVYHVGFQPAFGVVTVPGVLPVGSAQTLALDVDRLLESDSNTLPSPQHSVPDGWVVDNLESNGVFSLQ